jgi:hypothetical protein
MSWLSKKLKKVTKVIDPIGNQLRKQTGGSYGDPLNFYSKPQLPPGAQPVDNSLKPQIGQPGPTVRFGGAPGGKNYVDNPFAAQMAQVAALRGNPAIGGPQAGMGGPEPLSGTGQPLSQIQPPAKMGMFRPTGGIKAPTMMGF